MGSDRDNLIHDHRLLKPPASPQRWLYSAPDGARPAPSVTPGRLPGSPQDGPQRSGSVDTRQARNAAQGAPQGLERAVSGVAPAVAPRRLNPAEGHPGLRPSTSLRSDNGRDAESSSASREVIAL